MYRCEELKSFSMNKFNTLLNNNKNTQANFSVKKKQNEPTFFY